MEYLMTYGWAILIIAIVMAAIFSLGLFNTNSFIGTTCRPNSGFMCSNPIYSQGQLTVTIGQASTNLWRGVSFYVKGAKGGIARGIINPAAPTLENGQTVKVTFNMININAPASLFALYNITSVGSPKGVSIKQ